MKQRTILKLFTIILAHFFVTGCSSQYLIEVNSINNKSSEIKKSYFLIPAVEGVNENNLLFQEYSAYIHQALQQKGFNPAQKDSAELVIFVTYGISDPKIRHFSYSSPVYGTNYFSGSVVGTGGVYGYQGTSYGVVGSQTFSGSIAVYLRYLILDAYDAKIIRESNGKNLVQLWETTVTSAGRSNDLRQVLPLLSAASSEYIGTNTGKKIKFTLKEDDERVKAVKGQLDI